MTLKRLIFINISTFNQLISNSAILSSLKLAYNGQNFHIGGIPNHTMLLKLTCHSELSMFLGFKHFHYFQNPFINIHCCVAVELIPIFSNSSNFVYQQSECI